MRLSRDHRNVSVLALCQGLFITGQSILFILAGLVGASLTEQLALATLPISGIIVATALTTIPASLLMKRIGRKPGFMIGAVFGIIGALVASYGIWQSSFWIFTLGTTIIGIYGAFAQYYRFAAADVAEANFKSKAISLVISGGIVAAFSGPLLTNMTFDINVIPFLGSFITVAILAGISIIMLALIDIPRPDIAERASSGRPLREIARQPELLAAIFVGMVGYSVMSLLMTATPLAMIAHGYMVHDASFVIQWHLIGMFAPAFFTGSLIERFGVRKVMFAGTILLTAAIVAALAGETIPHFWIALFALGLGWNFTFIGASSLLTETYQPEERAKVQALNDFMVFGAVALASLTSGTVLHFFDWRTVNLAAIPAIVLAAVVIMLLIVRRRRSLA
jgi:MFS family permease